MEKEGKFEFVKKYESAYHSIRLTSVYSLF